MNGPEARGSAAASPAELQRWAGVLGCDHCRSIEKWRSRTSDLWRLECPNGREVLVRRQRGLNLEDVKRLHRLYSLLHRALEAQTRVHCPDSLGIDQVSNSHLMQFVRGQPADDAVRNHLARNEYGEAAQVAIVAARALAAFHAAMQQLRDESSLPNLPGPSCAETKPGSAVASSASWERPLFGDFALYNLLLAPEGAWLIDLPARVRIGGIATDLGAFAFHLRRTAAWTLPPRQARRFAHQAVAMAVDAYAQEVGSHGAVIRQAVWRAEARRAFGMARKRWRSGSQRGACGYFAWSVSALVCRSPRLRSGRL